MCVCVCVCVCVCASMCMCLKIKRWRTNEAKEESGRQDELMMLIKIDELNGYMAIWIEG